MNNPNQRVLQPHAINDCNVPAKLTFQHGGPSKPLRTFNKDFSEEERRSRLYDSLVFAQRRYAEKVSFPTGKGYRFTKEEWDLLGENFKAKDWEGGFLIEESCHRHPSNHATKKENKSSWKGKERVVEVDTEDEDDDNDAATLMMVL